ncbi:MAG: hypothetical protein EXR00_05875 [Alphaproteobacteria bacterium]|nr:hypothetical protein [Alphaproteobacteria bacterium]
MGKDMNQGSRQGQQGQQNQQGQQGQRQQQSDKGQQSGRENPQPGQNLRDQIEANVNEALVN